MNGKRLTIGCFLGRAEEFYQQEITKGISEYCKEKDINIISYSGRPLDIPNKFESLCNIIYNFVSTERIDGLIVISGVLCQFIEKERLEDLLSKINIPKVSISMVLTDIPSVFIDNEKGMFDAVEHLINIHKYRKIAFIAGPRGHQEAESRFEGYKKALKKYGIPLNQDLIIYGNFLETSGNQAINILFKEKKLSIDAIVAANDEMAMGASMELEKLGILVPNDIAIVGFDDSLKSKLINPPMTTVHQPLHKLGKEAAKIIVQKIIKNSYKENVILSTNLVIRRSCGCFSEVLSNSKLDINQKTKKFGDILPINEDVISNLKKSLKKYSESIDIRAIEILCNSLLEYLNNKDNELFLVELDKLLKLSSLKNEDLDNWNDLISEIRKFCLPYIISDNELLLCVENLFHQSRILIGETQKRIEAYYNYLEERNNLLFLRIIEDFHLAHTVPNLVKNIINNIGYLGLKSCYLSLYDNLSNNFEESNILIAYDERGIVKDINYTKFFPTSLLVPNEIIPNNRRFEWIVEALRSHDEKQFGFVILEPIEGENAKSGRISFHISVSLEEAYLFEEREELLIKLEKTNENLEAFNSIVSHDLKTPLTSILGFLNLYLDKYNLDLDSEAKELINYAIQNSYQMNNLIKDLLSYSYITQSKEKEEAIDFNDVISEIIIYLDSLIKKNSAKIIYENLPIVRGEKIQIKQLFQNLIENSIKFKGEEDPRIEIKAIQEIDQWLFSVQDNGIGIDPKDHDEIFKVFKRIHHDKEYPGTGIGLSICKKVIERHKGKIWVDSELGKGTTFYFTLPRF